MVWMHELNTIEEGVRIQNQVHSALTTVNSQPIKLTNLIANLAEFYSPQS
ncbi:hypothetical protein NSTC745_01841 [Nostoc sp. DSM 114161]|jgi:hypothetical protein